MIHVSELIRRTGAADGCLSCGKLSTSDELWECRCCNCGGRVFTPIETHWYEDSSGEPIPHCVIDYRADGQAA